MKSYSSYFKLKFITGLQYRAAALAGIATQFFFGFVFISVYIACYESGNGVIQNLHIANEWFMKASNLGHKEALNKIRK